MTTIGSCGRDKYGSKHVKSRDELFRPGSSRAAALNCASEMILDALDHVDECIQYMACLTEKSVFNFIAITLMMIIARLELCFRIKSLFSENIRITRGQACQLMLLVDKNDVTFYQFYLHIFAESVKRTIRWTQILQTSAVPVER